MGQAPRGDPIVVEYRDGLLGGLPPGRRPATRDAWPIWAGGPRGGRPTGWSADPQDPPSRLVT